MIVWGGDSTGGKYDPRVDQWSAISTGANCPAACYGHTAVWTGTEMIIWGGQCAAADDRSDGRYDPASDSWMPTSMGTGCPGPREYHTAIWTEEEMIVAGIEHGADCRLQI